MVGSQNWFIQNQQVSTFWARVLSPQTQSLTAWYKWKLTGTKFWPIYSHKLALRSFRLARSWNIWVPVKASLWLKCSPQKQKKYSQWQKTEKKWNRFSHATLFFLEKHMYFNFCMSFSINWPWNEIWRLPAQELEQPPWAIDRKSSYIATYVTHLFCQFCVCRYWILHDRQSTNILPYIAGFVLFVSRGGKK